MDDMPAPPQPAGTVVILSRVPAERSAEYGDTLSALSAALDQAGLPHLVVDSVYDMRDDSAGVAFLRSIKSGLVLLGWHHPRALRWILARHGVDVTAATRAVHCLDVRGVQSGVVVAQVKEALSGTVLAEEPAPPSDPSVPSRWYPVLDYSLCTNCMECLDFCLFGVYGVDRDEKLRVVSPDQCRQDCPACARVCPVGAIIFPKYQGHPAIAGAEDAGKQGTGKLDLSALFGKPSALTQAEQERGGALRKPGPAAPGDMERLAAEFDKLGL